MTRESQDASRVLVFDTEQPLVKAYARMLGAAGLLVDTCSSAAEAQELLKHGERYSVIVTDVLVPGTEGAQFLSTLRAADPEAAIVIVTGRPSLQSTIAGVEAGIFGYLVKPVTPAALCKTVAAAAARYRLGALKRRALQLCESEGWHSAKGVRLADDFEAALSGVFMVYQPIVTAAGGLFGYEGLVRTESTALGSPELLFAAGDRLGRTRELGRKIRALVSQQIDQAPRDCVLFVNLHAGELADPELYSKSSELSASAERVVLEITERRPLNGIVDVRGKVSELRSLGYRIAIDDLGAGYAGLSSLNLIEPEMVKLDMSLIRDIDSAPRKQPLVRSMIRVCQRELGMRVICEGVETTAEREVLVEAGAELLQGYLFGRPEREFGYRVPS